MSKKSEAVVKRHNITDMVDLLEDLEKNYTDMLHMFMNSSKRMIENASFVQAMVDSTKHVDNDDLRRISDVRTRLHRSLTAVRNDFVKQTQQILDSPVFSKSLKEKVQELRKNTKQLNETTNPSKKTLYGGSNTSRTTKGGKADARRKAK